MSQQGRPASLAGLSAAGTAVAASARTGPLPGAVVLAVPPASVVSAVAAGARRTADALATRGGIRVEPIDRPAAAAEVMRLFSEVWRTSERDTPVSPDLLLALGHSGGYVVGAYDDERLVGASMGFLGAHRTLHSHISGVLATARGRNVGHALKLDQRAWALEHGLGCVSWTFDPLVRRNAWFNLAKLAARGRQYLPDFYGPMRDGINAGEQSDRLLVLWDLTTEQVAAAAAGVWLSADESALVAQGAAVVLDEGADRRPVALRGASTGQPLLVRVPVDIERLRGEDPTAARSWRGALRDALAGPLDAGWSAVGFTRGGCYVLRPPAGAGSPAPRP